MKNFLKILTALGIIGGLVFLLMFTEASHSETKCSGLKVMVSYPGSDTLLTVEEIKQIVLALGESLSNMPVDDINIENIEQQLNQHPYIISCDALVTINGCLLIKARQRRPLIRIINNKGSSYIIDDKGYILPYAESHPVRLLMANGNIKDYFSFNNQAVYHLDSLETASQLPELYEIALVLEKDAFNRFLIAQIYINDKNKFEFIPSIGGQLITLGDVKDLEIKLDNLKAFYQYVITRKGWEYYKNINIEYQNQVICSK